MRICREFGALCLEGWVLVVLEMAVLSRRMRYGSLAPWFEAVEGGLSTGT